jgi:hypothetical protein
MVGSNHSVIFRANFGSSLSIRSFTKLNSGCSIAQHGALLMRISMSVMDLMELGSNVSIRIRSSSGGKTSVLGGAVIGSSLSLRRFCRYADKMSVFSGMRAGGFMSIVS